MFIVLIVAKCIVNLDGNIRDQKNTKGINSSKVYCKWRRKYREWRKQCVLIVAKCIVNNHEVLFQAVLRVRINSSKVYCKFSL